MSQHGHESASTGQSLADKNYFLVRRLHSLAGIVPVGVFLCVHLITNASILGGGEAFQKQVAKIHALPALKLVEVFGILLPLAFHAVFGVKIWLSGRSNAQQYRERANIRYTLQRVTGGIAFVFILYHLWHMHWVGTPLGGGKFVFEEGTLASARTTAEAIQASPWIAPFYALGILSSVFHLSNGLWTALITWGLTIRPRTQQVAGYLCAAFGLLLGAAGLGALAGFRNFKPIDSSAASSPPAAPVVQAARGD
ncbi:MAG: Succinate dehydrogenase cytochrome b558 subunit [Phycisphaerae bacterium]|nr:Succinate dehydrogenase cytochrome b558 subunit [Phycisphaerae bacterium]